MSAVGRRRDSSHERICISSLAMTEKCSSSQQLFSPYCVLWIQKVGKIAKGPAMKLVADVRADMVVVGSMFFPSRGYYVLTSSKPAMLRSRRYHRD